MVAGTPDRKRVRRHPERGVYDRIVVDDVLDEAIFCHVAFVHQGQPFAIPTIHARVGDVVYLHGSPASRMLRQLARGVEVCVTATILDGVVLARSVSHHSLNYRSAMVFGRAHPVSAHDEKSRALDAIVEHVVPGRTADARPPNAKELMGTLVLRLPIGEASAKVRTGPPTDVDEDLALPVWAGVIPLRVLGGEPEADSHAPGTVSLPSYARTYRRGVEH